MIVYLSCKEKHYLKDHDTNFFKKKNTSKTDRKSQYYLKLETLQKCKFNFKETRVYTLLFHTLESRIAGF